MTAMTLPTLEPGLLAEHANTARRHAGPCFVCGFGIRTGDRYAVVVGPELPAHLPCISRQALAPAKGAGQSPKDGGTNIKGSTSANSRDRTNT